MFTFSNYVIMVDEDDWKEHYPQIRNNFTWDKSFDPRNQKNFRRLLSENIALGTIVIIGLKAIKQQP